MFPSQWYPEGLTAKRMVLVYKGLPPYFALDNLFLSLEYGKPRLTSHRDPLKPPCPSQSRYFWVNFFLWDLFECLSRRPLLGLWLWLYGGLPWRYRILATVRVKPFSPDLKDVYASIILGRPIEEWELGAAWDCLTTRLCYLGRSAMLQESET